ncbi:hypothetical protein ABEB36_012926 [Hypothenemus hampei]|uniref:THAP-type domain-containing protein n=1 Tax=Hypothenemus hampei TaxID=57062 RepID=A0ABD1E676_HYPHA
MVSCVACGCSSTAGRKAIGLTFHNFPKDAKRREFWIKFVKKPDWVPNKRSLLCSNHFVEECFNRTSKVQVRLRPTALPTVEVSRLKYVKSSNLVYKKPHEEKEIFSEVTFVSEEQSSLVPQHISSLSPPSTSKLHLDKSLEDTPRKKSLKKQIIELGTKDILKSHKIRKLQKITWHQKKKINSLKSILMELKTKNIMLKEQEDILLEQFGTNKDIIKRLFQKTQNKGIHHT